MRDVIDFILALTLFAVLICMPPKSWGCDCTFFAIQALQKVGIHLKTIPSIAVNDFHRFPGVYANGVVIVKDPSNCRILIHEFTHAAQEERYGKVLNDSDWFKRERDAAIVTMFATEMRGDCE